MVFYAYGTDINIGSPVQRSAEPENEDDKTYLGEVQMQLAETALYRM